MTVAIPGGDAVAQRSTAALTAAVAIASIAWFAVLLQVVLSMRMSIANGRSALQGLAVVFGYFTVLTNTLVAITVTAPLVARHASIGRFFARPGVHAAVAGYIAVVGIVYSVALRHVWDPQGWQLVADRLLHDAVPLLFVLYWWFVVPKRGLRVGDIAWWLAYPLAYLAVALVRGAATGFYPYPFIEVPRLGYPRTLANALLILVGYGVLAAVLVFAARFAPRATR